jgi:integrase/recombinase XerC
MDKHIYQFIQHLQSERRLSAHTVKSYQNDLIQYQTYLSSQFELYPHQAKSEHIRSWMVTLKETGVSNRTINRKIASLRSFYKFLLISNIITQNPAAKITAPKIEKRLPSFVSEKEMDNLFNYIQFEDTKQARRDKLILQMFYYTGMRRSELINLKISDIDLYNQTIRVFGKRNKERIIPAHPKLINSIKQYLKENNNKTDYLFETDKQKPLNPRVVYSIVKKYLEQVTTIKNKSPHTIRHTFATHMLNNGADLNSIKEILGHANLAATQVYTHNTVEKIKKIHKQAHPRG